MYARKKHFNYKMLNSPLVILNFSSHSILERDQNDFWCTCILTMNCPILWGIFNYNLYNKAEQKKL